MICRSPTERFWTLQVLQMLWTGIIKYQVYHLFPFFTSSFTLLPQHSEDPCFLKWLVLIAHIAIRLVSRPWSRLEYNHQQSSPIYSCLTVLTSHWFLCLLSRGLYTKLLFNTTLSHTNTHPEAISLARYTCVEACYVHTTSEDHFASLITFRFELSISYLIFLPMWHTDWDRL